MPEYYYTTVACPYCNAAGLARTFDCKTYTVICCNPRCSKHGVWINAMFVECDACNSPCVAYELKKPESKFDNPRYQYTCRVHRCEKRGRTRIMEIDKHGYLVKPERV